MVDTYSINLYGSQKHINKKLDPNKLIYSGKSNVSMNSARGDKQGDRGFKRQNSLGSKKSGLNSDHNTKQKVQQVGKGQNLLSNHLRGKLGGAFMHQHLGTNFMSAVFNLGTAAALSPDLRNQGEGDDNLPVQEILKNQLRNQTAVGLILSQTQPIEADDDKKQEENKDDPKKDDSGSFEDFKSEQSFNSNSDEGVHKLGSGGGSIGKDYPSSKPRGSFKTDFAENMQVDLIYQPEEDAHQDSEENTLVANKKNRWKAFLMSLDHFPATKPYIEGYYLDKMTSMYAVNFKRSIVITIAYKIVIEVFNFLESGKFTYRTFITIGKIFLLFAYSFLGNIRFIREQTRDFKIILIICILVELCLYITDIQYLNASHLTLRTNNFATE